MLNRADNKPTTEDDGLPPDRLGFSVEDAVKAGIFPSRSGFYSAWNAGQVKVVRNSGRTWITRSAALDYLRNLPAVEPGKAGV